MPRKSASAPGQTATSRAQRPSARNAASKASAKSAVKPAADPTPKRAAKPGAKLATKPAAKSAAKPGARAATKSAPAKGTLKAVVKTAARALAQPPARKSAATPATPATRSAARAAPRTAAAERAPAQDARPVLVRDSFTMPEHEYAVLLEVKQACLRAGIDVKKSELLRIGVALLGQLDVAALQGVLAALPQLKTGRPPAQD